MPLLLLDIDDVICLNTPYGGYDVLAREHSADLWSRLWHPPAMALLCELVQATQAQVVLTTSWLRFLQLDAMAELFRRTGVGILADALHPNGEVLPLRGQTRLQAIEAWLQHHGVQQRYAILDDHLSGTGLSGSRHDRAGRVVLCEVDVGLQAHHIPQLERALRR